MAIRTIRKEGDDILKKKAKPVQEVNAATLALVDDMLETMRSIDGVGIAAPQVGALKRIVVIEYEEDLYELINPEIVEIDGNQVCNEACLSVPGRCGDVDRPFKITVQAMNRAGEIQTHTVDDFMASVFCHEIDHLDGILFLDKARNVQLISDEQLKKRKRERRERARERRRAAGRR
ncbi:MAG: peptide deformylase [Defluviitaleaceae bacterium]|nr:peptide deformylase [Defluviitaleaceae bacterium]